MFWTLDRHSGLARFVLLVAGGASLGIGTGCQVAQPRAQDRVDSTPILVDDAMKARPWKETNAVYPNFSTTTGPTEFLFVPYYNMDPYLRAFDESPVFVANVAALPVAMIETPPWSQVETASLYIPPTYTANPPLTPLNRVDFSGGPSGSTYTPAYGRAYNPPATPAPVHHAAYTATPSTVQTVTPPVRTHVLPATRP